MSSGPGLYLHVPFCAGKCPYCDFASTATDQAPEFYSDLVLAEIAQLGQSWAPFDTVYFGGGTPSLLAPALLARILEGLGESLTLAPEVMIFLEVNPEHVTPQSLAAWRQLGVTSLSLGVQSFSWATLRGLGRRHDGAVARRCVEFALAAGFSTVSVDLIYGHQSQDLSGWRRELEQILALGPDHISCYQLTVHSETPFGRRRARGETVQACSETVDDMFFLAHQRLAEAGYEAYELANFAAAPVHRSRHNSKYWNHTPYLGLGPSAHSFSGTRRWFNCRSLAEYQQRLAAGRSPQAGSESLAEHDLALETVMLGLRTRQGVDLKALRATSGCDLAAGNRELIARAVADGLLQHTGSRLAPTLRGMAVADSLARSFHITGANA